jgi:ribosome-associated protein
MAKSKSTTKRPASKGKPKAKGKPKSAVPIRTNEPSHEPPSSGPKRAEAASNPKPEPARTSKSAPAAPADAARTLAIECARLVRDDKCEDVQLLDVRGLSQVTDYLIVASGTSERQMRSVLQHVDELGTKHGYSSYRSHSDDRSTWLLLDFVDVVVHLFEPNTRAHYDLETLWGDAPRVDWERPDQRPRDRAGLHA